MMRVHTMSLAAALVTGLVFSTASVWAQEAPTPDTPPATAPATEPEVSLRTAHGQRVYVVRDPVHVPGRVPRPYNFGVEGRAAPGYTYAERPVGFVREILASTRRAPL